jgi:hypothetical protein
MRCGEELRSPHGGTVVARQRESTSRTDRPILSHYNHDTGAPHSALSVSTGSPWQKELTAFDLELALLRIHREQMQHHGTGRRHRESARAPLSNRPINDRDRPLTRRHFAVRLDAQKRVVSGRQMEERLFLVGKEGVWLPQSLEIVHTHLHNTAVSSSETATVNYRQRFQFARLRLPADVEFSEGQSWIYPGLSQIEVQCKIL